MVVVVLSTITEGVTAFVASIVPNTSASSIGKQPANSAAEMPERLPFCGSFKRDCVMRI